MSVKITAEQFATWSFERDQAVGLFPESTSFATLGADERDGYLEEARFYLKGGPEPKGRWPGWPSDILERVKQEGEG